MAIQSSLNKVMGAGVALSSLKKMQQAPAASAQTKSQNLQQATSLAQDSVSTRKQEIKKPKKYKQVVKEMNVPKTVGPIMITSKKYKYGTKKVIKEI